MRLERPYLQQINLDGDGKFAKKPYFFAVLTSFKKSCPHRLLAKKPI